MSKAERRYFTPQEVGNLTGFSAGFIRGEIAAGELKAVYVKPKGRKLGRWRITSEAAKAYAARLGERSEHAAQLAGWKTAS
jgi:hypothetical protein